MTQLDQTTEVSGSTGSARPTGRGMIEIRGARQNNLKDVSLDIPKGRITVFTGVSGSGKSSLVFGTIAAESQRLINETFTAFLQSLLPRSGQPDADSLANLSAAIVVDQKRLGGNSRSTVGTVTDTSAMLRALYARLGSPAAGGAKAYSFNDPSGMCAACEGLGRTSDISVEALIDSDLSLNEGAIRFSTFAVDSWFWNIFAQSGFFDNDKKLRDYDAEEWHKLLHLKEAKISHSSAGGVLKSKYEGLIPKFKRLYLSKDVADLAPHLRIAVDRVVTRGACAECAGSRLSAAARESRIGGVNIAECNALQVTDLARFVRSIDEPRFAPLTAALATRLDHLAHIGLGYLTLGRESSTLSGGESQRVKMVRHLGSSLTDVTYIFDEPSVGLHPHDIHRLNELLRRLRDKGNTVLVVEHKPDVMAIADHLVDMGPLAGRNGGQIVYQGDLAGLLTSGTLTGRHLTNHQVLKAEPRTRTGELRIQHANQHNLRDLDVTVPKGVLTVVTGVAGAGKSSLILGCLPEHHPDLVVIDQSMSRGSSRSNVATYTGALDSIRKAFAARNKVSAALFSANSKGACPECQGLGLIYTELAHMDPTVTVCESCEGQRFTEDVLRYTLRDKNISDVFKMSVEEAKEFFSEPEIRSILEALDDVGIGYITLGQPLNTLSGGERQRLKLANELGNSSQVYVLDEPTTGLHMNDVDNLIRILDTLVSRGSTVIVIEHNLNVIARADWVIDLGPGAGHDGGSVVFEGTPGDLAGHPGSVTGQYLAAHLE